MWNWLRRSQRREQTTEVLRGSPARPRTKTYSADTGLAYQYTYRGYLQIAEPDSAREHIFSITRDRENTFSLSIHIRNSAIRVCEEQIGRTLLDAEQYAIVKLTLFATFDSVREVTALTEPVIPSSAEMEIYLRRLGRV